MTAPTTVMLAPEAITVDSNIRKTVKVDKPFWASVKQDGVIVPVIVERRDDDTMHLVDGQRRILAAVDAGHAEIPATIIDTSTNGGEHIVRQLVVNEHREQLTDADRVAATQTLFELGLTADQIARKTKTPKARVETALKVIASENASKAIATMPAITLEHAAALAEFDDSPELAEELTAAAVNDPGRFDHTVSRLRDERQIAAATAAEVAALEAAGVKVIEWPGYNHSTIVNLRDLSPTAAAAKSYSRIQAEDHVTCPGHAIHVSAQMRWGAGNSRELQIDHYAYCTDWKANGHFKQGSSAAASGGLDEKEKQARKEARENNKAWTSATPVRTAFLQNLLAQTEPPAGWELFAATYLARGTDADYRIRGKVAELLHIDDRGSQQKFLDAQPKRAAHLILAHAIASIEGEYEYGKSGWKSERTPAYLRLLSTWGYTLADIEETIAQKATS